MGIMLVYDITNEKSFENIKNWIRNIEEHAGESAAAVRLLSSQNPSVVYVMGG